MFVLGFVEMALLVICEDGGRPRPPGMPTPSGQLDLESSRGSEVRPEVRLLANFAEMDRRKRMGADADQPHRIKYRRIDA
jgi:hypothetical protein